MIEEENEAVEALGKRKKEEAEAKGKWEDRKKKIKDDNNQLAKVT